MKMSPALLLLREIRLSKPRRVKGRDLNGIFVLDKPQGITSNRALQIAKRIYAAEKAGHTGSLDPLATGVLPLCFGEATKFSQYLLDSDKAYVVTAKMGQRTASGDAEGEVLETCSHEHVTEELLLETLKRFKGEVKQIPSMYSALKHNGQPLYKLARQGLEVERAPRTVMIHSVVLTGLTEDTFSLEVECSKGTYIRSLVEDVAEAMGTFAHVVMLRRTRVGPYMLNQAHTLDELDTLLNTEPRLLDDYLLSADTSVADWVQLSLDYAQVRGIKHGRAVVMSGYPSGPVALRGPEGEFIGIGEVTDDGRLLSRRLVKTS